MDRRTSRIWLAATLGVAAVVALLWGMGVLDPWLGNADDQDERTTQMLEGDAHGAVSLEGSGDKRVIPADPIDASLPPPVNLDAADRERDLHGIVVQKDGTPIAGAHLQVFTRPWRRASILDFDNWETEVLGPTTLSAKDGTFSIPLRQGTSVSLRAKAVGFATIALEFRQPGERLRVVMHPGVRLILTAVSAEKKPLEGVAFEVGGKAPAGGATCLAKGVTNADGVCRFDGLPAAAGIRIDGSHGVLGGWVSNWDRLALPATGELAHTVVIPAGRVITGRVTDATTGRPIAGARVGMGWTFHKETTTDDEGRYAIGGWTGDGYHEIHVLAKGYGREAKNVGTAETLDVQMQPGFTLTGRVVGPGSMPVADAHVAIIGSERRGGRQVQSTGSALTDARGHFLLEDLRRDLEHRFVAMPQGFGRHLVRVPKPAGGSSTVDLGDVLVSPGMILSGRVLDMHGKPLAHADVSLNGPLHPDANEDLSSYGRNEERMTDDLGRFAFGDLGPGHYVVESGIHGQDKATAQATLESGVKPPEVIVRFAPRHALRVDVVDEKGKPVSGATVYAMPLGAGDRYAHTGTEGVATLHYPVHVTKVQLGLFEHSDRYLPWDHITIAADVKSQRIVLKTAAHCRGKLLDEKGKPILRARVAAHRDAEVVGSASTDAEGAFTIAVPPGGLVDLIFMGDVYRQDEETGWRTRRRIPLSARQERMPVGGDPVVLRAVAIPAVSTLTVHTVDIEGKSIAGVQLKLEPAPLDGASTAVSDAKGKAVFTGLTQHPVAVHANPPDSERALAPVEATNVVPSGQTLALLLQPPLVVEGVVVDADGVPLAGVAVSSASVIAGKQPSTKTDEDGRFRISLPPDFDRLLSLYAHTNGPKGVTLFADIGAVDPRAGPVRMVAKPHAGW